MRGQGEAEEKRAELDSLMGNMSVTEEEELKSFLKRIDPEIREYRDEKAKVCRGRW